MLTVLLMKIFRAFITSINNDGIRVTLIRAFLKIFRLKTHVFVRQEELDMHLKTEIQSKINEIKEDTKKNYIKINDPKYMIDELSNTKLVYTKLTDRAIKKNISLNPSETFSSVNRYVTKTLADYASFLHMTALSADKDVEQIFNFALQIDQNNELFIYEQYIEYLWKFKYSSSLLAETLKRFEDCANIKDQMPSQAYLIYMSFLLEHGQQDKCSHILEKFIQANGKEHIHNYIPVANLAHNLGYTNEQITKASAVYKNQENNIDLLSHYVKNKSIAVVGSAPNEIGNNKGAEIDQHDIVIRFNDYQISAYQNDYGTKTTAWVRNMNVVMDPRYNELDDFDIIISEADIWHYKISDKLLDIFYEYTNKKTPVCYLQHRDELTQKINAFPTSGAQMIYNLFLLKDKISNIDAYGFSFLDNPHKQSETSNTAHYFDHQSNDKNKLRLDSLHHEQLSENAYLSNLYTAIHKE